MSLTLQEIFEFPQPARGAKHSPPAPPLGVPSGKVSGFIITLTCYRTCSLSHASPKVFCPVHVYRNGESNNWFCAHVFACVCAYACVYTIQQTSVLPWRPFLLRYDRELVHSCGLRTQLGGCQNRCQRVNVDVALSKPKRNQHSPTNSRDSQTL